MENYKLADIIILSTAVAFFIIGVHQLFVFSEARGLQDGIMASYWIFMVVAALLMWIKFRKDKIKNIVKNTDKPISLKQNLSAKTRNTSNQLSDSKQKIKK
jgi:TM2 domain-containing membrane protein YozV